MARGFVKKGGILRKSTRFETRRAEGASAQSGRSLFLQRDSAAQALPACAIPAPLRGACKPSSKKRNRTSSLRFFASALRRKRDSNPRNVAVQQFSRLPPSTTRPFLRNHQLSRQRDGVQIYEFFDKFAKFARLDRLIMKTSQI